MKLCIFLSMKYVTNKLMVSIFWLLSFTLHPTLQYYYKLLTGVFIIISFLLPPFAIFLVVCSIDVIVL